MSKKFSIGPLTFAKDLKTAKIFVSMLNCSNTVVLKTLHTASIDYYKTKVHSRYDLAASLTFCTFNPETCQLNFYQKIPNKAKH